MKILKFRTAEDADAPSEREPSANGDKSAETEAHRQAESRDRANDEHHDSNRQSAQESAQGVNVKTPGSRLRAARNSRNLTIEQVAAELNLSRDTIAAIEEEDYNALPEKTYVQGYLKSYARLVDVSETDVIGPSVNPTLVEAETKAIKPARVLPEPKRPGSGLGAMLLGLVGLMIAAAVWMGYQQEWFSMSPDTASVSDTVRLGPGTTATDNTITASKTVEPISPGSEQSVTFGKRKTVEVVSGQVPATPPASVSTSESSVTTSVANSTSEPEVTTVTDVEINTSDPNRPAYNPEVVVIPTPSTAAAPSGSIESEGEVVETIIETVTISPTGEEIKTVEIIAGNGTITADSTVSSVQSGESDAVEEVAATQTDETETVDTTDGNEVVASNPAWPELVLTGQGDSWVEVVDAAGDKVFVQMIGNEQSYRVQGQPPLTVLIGNAPAVEMTFDGEEIDVQGAANSSNVARLTLGE